MKKLFVVFSILFLCIYGCAPSKTHPPAIKIANINISASEFEQAFKNSPFSSEDTPESRKKFLNVFITRMLILKEAEKAGLDKDPVFLKSVELFWQQSLIKLTLDNKINDVSQRLTVSEDEIKNYYGVRKESDFKDQELPAVYENIKWLIVNQKQQGAMDAWLSSLRDNAKVDVNYGLLNIER